jgi:acetyl esterase
MPMPVQLEPEAESFAEATAKPPDLFDLSPKERRKAVDPSRSRKWGTFTDKRLLAL